jgi:hypothetical protein
MSHYWLKSIGNTECPHDTICWRYLETNFFFQNGDTLAVSLNAEELQLPEIVYRMLVPSSDVAPYDYHFFWH